MCFTCWLRSGFSHFINMDSLSFTWYLVAAESRISKQSGVQDALQNSELCRCLKTFEDLSESKCSRTRVELCKIARALNSTAISKYVTLKMTDVPSKHVWKIKESCYVYTTIYIVAAI